MMSAPVERRVYQSENLQVQVVPAADTTRWVVTFDHLDLGQGFDREGFAEQFLRQQGVSAVHFMGVGPDWYQYPDLDRAIEAARSVYEGAVAVMAYGSSMGGYAALRLGERLGATSILAVSPQYSIDPKVVPFERRWLRHGRRLRYVAAMKGPMQTGVRPLVVYDPMGVDRQHVRLIERDIEIRSLALPFCGHPAMTFLLDTGELKSLVLEELSGTLDRRALQQRLRAARHNSGIYFSGRAAELRGRRPDLAVRSGERAVELLPNNDVTLLWLARAQRDNGQYEASLETHRRLFELCGPRFTLVSSYVRSLLSAGREDEARAVAVAFVALGEGQMQPRALAWSASVARGVGDLRASLDLYWRAYRVSPDEPDVRRQLVIVLWLYAFGTASRSMKRWLQPLRQMLRQGPHMPVLQGRSEAGLG